MRSTREVKKHPDGCFDVVTTKRYSNPDEILRLRDRLRGDVNATRNLLAQLEAELADVEAAHASLGES